MSPRRRAITVATSITLTLATLAGIVIAGVAVTASKATSAAPRRPTDPLPERRPSSRGPLVVAVALGTSATVGSDALAPYEVFASSPRFSVYTVAATTDPAPIQSGPSIVPTFTFADTSTGRAPRPDVVVVPAVADPDGDQETLLREWVIDQSHRGALILGVCAGSRLLAATGILEGRRATSHWSRLGALRASHPEVNWVDGRRYVQDGRITTTAGVTSGIPGALRVMADLVGPAEARRIGGLVGYPHWSLEESVAIPVQSLTGADLPIGLNAALPWHRPTVGIAMADGVGEIALASAFEIYAVSYAATAVPIASGGVAVTKHGVVILGDIPAAAPPVSRLVIPQPAESGSVQLELRSWAERTGLTIDHIMSSPAVPAFDAALTYLAKTAGHATAMSAAKMIDYPTAHLVLPRSASGWRTVLLTAIAVAASIAVGALPARRRRRGASANPTSQERRRPHRTPIRH